MTSKRNQEIAYIATAEIARMRRPLDERRTAIVAERAALYSDALRNGNSAGAPLQLDEDEKAARQHAIRLLGGVAPDSLSLPPPTSRDNELYREMRGIDIALGVLGNKELAARAVEAVKWAEDHGKEWRELCRQTTLAAIRSAALERRVYALIAEVDIEFSPKIVMTEFVGRPGVSVGEMTAAALAEGIVTRAEIREAENV